MNNIYLVEKHVVELLKNKLPTSYTYHNLDHTLAVVKAVTAIANHQNLSSEDKEKLIISAWFHDTGYIYGCDDHEDKSIQIASRFLTEHKYSELYCNDVAAYINCTKLNVIPKNALEYIIRDADYHHFATAEYIEKSELLRDEWLLTQNKSFTDKEWITLNIEMFSKKHRYYSSYAIENWQIEKDKNYNRLLEKLTQLNSTPMDTLKKEKKKKEDKPEKSIDTMFKITLTNHIRLSEIADSKANILLSVNAIIISIALSSIIPKLDSPGNEHLIIPTFIMVLFSVMSIVFAILSTKPKVTSGTFTREDIEEKKVNLLFFGNFYKMPYGEFEWAMNEMIKDKEYLNNSMIKDLYYLGIVLERKYRLLRLTYNIFMIGIIVSVIAFVIAFRGFSL
jgi:predicted metal-dependent HD superfamily phosphohydrolase